MNHNTERTDNRPSEHVEKRHIVIYGYTRKELAKVLRHFEQELPEFVRITFESDNRVTTVTLTGINSGLELLRFQINKYHRSLHHLFGPEVVTTEKKSIPEVLGELLTERELTVSVAESCTGGNIAHRITEMPGSSSYFLGSVVSYSNDVKSDVLSVPRADIANHGAVSRQVAEAMARGVAALMHTDCSISTTGIAGPGGATPGKPVGTVWISAKYGDQVVTECQHFDGSRRDVIESATAHGMVMLINLVRNSYVPQDELNDD